MLNAPGRTQSVPGGSRLGWLESKQAKRRALAVYTMTYVFVFMTKTNAQKTTPRSWPYARFHPSACPRRAHNQCL
jgi:hypothetical protein